MGKTTRSVDDAFSVFEFQLESFADSLPYAWDDYPASVVMEWETGGWADATIERITSDEQRERLRECANRLRSYLPSFRGRYEGTVVDALDQKLIEAVGLLCRTSPESAKLAQGIADELRDALGRLQLQGHHVVTGPAPQMGIPAEYRTRAMTKREAAKYLGRPNPDSGVKWLNKCIEDGTIKCESLSERSHVFDGRQFPSNVQGRILPS